MIKALAHVCFRVRDLETAIAFYRAMGAKAVSDELPMGLAIDRKPGPVAG